MVDRLRGSRSRRPESPWQSELDSLRVELAAANAELLRRESYLTALLETIDVGIVSCGPGRTDWVRNRAARAMMGLDEGPHHALSPQDAAPRLDVLDAQGVPVPVDDYPVIRALRGEEPGAVELLLGPAGGRHREIISLNSQIRGKDGAVLGAVSALTDVTAERAAIRAVAEQHRQLAEAQRIGQLGSFEHDYGTGRWSYSEELLALWGLAGAGGEGNHQPLDEALIHPGDREAARADWSAACSVGGRHTSEYRIRRADDGTERLIRCSVEVRLGRDGVAELVRGTNLDITDVAAAEKAAQDANAFLHAVLTASPDYTVVTELATGAVVYGSRGKEVLGISSEQLEALGSEAIKALAHPEDREAIRAVNVAAVDMADGAVLQSRYRARHADGRWRWMNRRVTPFRRDASGAVAHVIGVLRDITDSVAVEERLTHTAQHDGLTGLPNRGLMMQRLQDALDRSVVDDREVTVLFCDLDGFKQVNDTAGHAAGDAVLRETGQRIAATLRGGDTVARVGGDEFVVILEPHGHSARPSGESQQVARDRNRALGLQVAERITAAVRRPITYAGTHHLVTASIGMIFATGSADADTDAGRQRLDAETVLQRADELMYRAKASGKDRFEVVAP